MNDDYQLTKYVSNGEACIPMGYFTDVASAKMKARGREWQHAFHDEPASMWRLEWRQIDIFTWHGFRMAVREEEADRQLSDHPDYIISRIV